MGVRARFGAVDLKERRMRELAERALEESDLEGIMELAGAGDGGTEASAALKAVLAERVAEYTMRAMKEAKKRKISFGAAAMVIGSKA
jgi:hypothetical protein